MIYSHISEAEEFACELLRAAEKKASAIASAGHPPLPTFEDFATSSFPEGLIDDSATVIELVLKHRLACDFMEQGDARERRAIECAIKKLGHNAQEVFDKLSESTQQEIRSIYSKCQRGYDDYFASINRRMDDFEEMLAWVHRVPTTGTPLHGPSHMSPSAVAGVRPAPRKSRSFRAFPTHSWSGRSKSSRTPSLYVRCVKRWRRNPICRPAEAVRGNPERGKGEPSGLTGLD